MPAEVIVTNGPQARAGTSGLVTVVVSCCGQLEYTRLCVPSLLRHSRPPFEIVFLDNDSLDGTAEYLDGVAAAAGVRVETARVPADPPTGPSRRDDIISLRGDFVALLHNDVIVPQGWLERLLALLCSAPDLGMAAPITIGTMGESGMEGVPHDIDCGFPPEDEPAPAAPARVSPWSEIDKINRFAQKWYEDNRGQSIESETLTGGCVVLKKPVLQKLGLFPTRTPLGTFDMEALSGRVRQAGYRLACSREVFVHDFHSRLPAGLPAWRAG